MQGFQAVVGTGSCGTGWPGSSDAVRAGDQEQDQGLDGPTQNLPHPAKVHSSILYQALTDAVLVCNLNGYVVDCNPAAEPMYGLSKEQMLGRRPDQFTGAPADPDRAAGVLASLREHGVWAGDVSLPGIENGIGATKVFAVHDHAGRVIAFACVTRDVTAERQACAALAQAERRWRSVLEMAPIGLAVAAMDGRLELVNPALCELVGYPADELVTMSLQDITHQEDQDAHRRLLEQMLSGQPGPYRLQKRYVHAQGHIVSAHVSLTLIREGSGGPKLLASIEDITTRQQDSARLAAILTSANDAFVGMTPTGHVSEWNRAAERLFGWSRAEAVGRRLAELIVPPDLRPAHEEGLRRMAAGLPGRILGQTLEIDACTRLGERVPVELTVWRSNNDEGSGIDEFYAFIRDRTERVETARRAQAVADAQLAIAEIELSPQMVMQEICRHAKEITDADFVSLEMQDGDELVCKAVAGMPHEVIGSRLPILGSLSGMALLEGSPKICDDTETDQRVNRKISQRFGTRSMVVVPLQRFGEAQGVHGILKVAARKPGYFGQPDAATLTLLAAPFGAALLNAFTMEASHRQASTDPFTGLSNRAHTLAQLDKALLRLARRLSRRPLAHTALVFLDLDRFKQVNDTHGHNTGDRLLAHVAQKILSVVRAGDTAARYGGDEFVLICEELASPADAHALARRLVAAIAGPYILTSPDSELDSSTDPHADATIEVDIGVSIGVAVTATHRSAADFLHAADEAMYEAKRQGGNTYVVRHFEASDPPSGQERSDG